MLPWALKNWKLIVSGIAILLLIGLTLRVSHLQNKLSEAKSDNQNLIKLYSDEHRQVKHYTNRLGQAVASNQALQLSNKAISGLMDSQEMRWLENFKDLKKSLKNLEVAQQVTARAYDSLKVRLEDSLKFYITPQGDTVKFKAVKMKLEDQYNRIIAEQISPDSGVIVMDIKVPLQQAIYWDKKWFLGRKHYDSEITSPNKKVSITKLQTIIAKRRKR